MARKYPLADVKLLYGNAAGRCCYSSCKKTVNLPETENDKAKQVGKIAHIAAHSKDGPRGDSDIPEKDRDRYANWVLLCGYHHDIVDIQPNTYTIADLKKMKADHETWVTEQLDEEVTNLTFAELKVATDAIVDSNTEQPSGFKVISPDQKIEKNKLSNKSRRLITTGLSQSHTVTDFLNQMANLNNGFADKLVTGFQDEYKRLLSFGFIGDELFDQMFDFAAGGSNDFRRRAAGLSILTHLFEQCDVFEK